MAANPKDIQEVARKRFPLLGNLRQVRKYMATKIRQMDRGEIEIAAGKDLVLCAKYLHRAILDEQAPAPGNTTNVLVLAGQPSPVLELAQELWGNPGAGAGQVIEAGVQEQPLVALDAGP